MRHALILALLIGLCPPMAVAQDRTQSLADIRQELSVLFVEMQRLRGELNTTGGAMGAGGGGTVLARIDAIEAELRRLTDQTEQLQIRVERVVADGTNRIGDLEFRLCELTPDCRIADLAATPALGGAGRCRRKWRCIARDPGDAQRCQPRRGRTKRFRSRARGL